jgi:hypothetical protein
MKTTIAILAIALGLPMLSCAQSQPAAQAPVKAEVPMTAEEFTQLEAKMEKTRAADPETFLVNSRTVLLAKTGLGDMPGFSDMLLQDSEYNKLLLLSGYSSAGDFALPEKHLTRFLKLTAGLSHVAPPDQKKCFAVVLATVTGEAERLKKP